MKSKKLVIILIIILSVGFLTATYFALDATFLQMQFNKETYTLELGSSFKPKIYGIRYKDYTVTVSNPTLAVSDGKNIKGEKEGIVTITATSGARTATASVAIMEHVDTEQPGIDENRIMIIIKSPLVNYSSITLNKGGKVEKPKIKNVDGYVFDDFYLDEAFTKEVDFSQEFRQNTIIYANYIIGQPYFTYGIDANGNATIKKLLYGYIPYKNLVLPSATPDNKTIVGIEEDAFKNNTNLVEVIIPDSIQWVGKNSFYKSAMLEKVTFEGNGLKEIRLGAFAECLKLSSVTLPNSLETLGDYAFQKCVKLTSIQLPSSLKAISSEAFLGTGLTSIDLNYITYVGQGAFANCKDLLNVNNYQNITTFSKLAFSETPFLQNIISRVGYFESNNILIAIPKSATEFTVPSNIEKLSDNLFYNNSVAVITFNSDIPPELGTNVFNSNNIIIVPAGKYQAYKTTYYSYRKQLYFQEMVNGLELRTNITDDGTNVCSLYRYSGSAETVDIGELAEGKEVAVIKEGAFNNNIYIKELILPQSVTSIENRAISVCRNLKSILIPHTGTPATITSTSFNFSSMHKDIAIYVLVEKFDDYFIKWGKFSSVKPYIKKIIPSIKG